MTLLQTSPLLFLRADGRSSVAGRPLNGRFSLSEIEMLSYFAEPASVQSAYAANISKEQIERALSLGLLVECNDTESGAGSTWEMYNLQRAAFNMFSSFEESNGPDMADGLAFREYLKASNSFAPAAFTANFSNFLKRRTERFFRDEPLSLQTLTALASEVNEAIADNDWLSFRLLVQTVDGLAPGIYRQDISGEFVECKDGYTRKDLLECLHGQWWLNGGGVCVFFVVSMAKMAGHIGNGPRNYFEMLVLLGAAGQALVNATSRHGLGCWMTPALSETLSTKILGLVGDEEEALYFFKVGIPERPEERAAEHREGEKRSPI